ncbi:MAG TPA: mechanosensitive ion channel domain-containing protein [Candidatus Thermoplasmatota archaeon]|nr:mechanosensitive ion channel domain-containing protein [Candidatus Thermoplasmatota archaeon]
MRLDGPALRALAARALLVGAAIFVLVLVLDGAAVPTLDLEPRARQALRVALIVAGVIVAMTLIRRFFRPRMRTLAGEAPTAFASFALEVAALLGGLVLALRAFGVDPSTILLASGVAAVAIGFAASTFITNVLSGILLVTSYPIRVGDDMVVTVANQTVRGVVSETGLLYTSVATDHGEVAVIPNGALVTGGAFARRASSRALGSRIEIPVPPVADPAAFEARLAAAARRHGIPAPTVRLTSVQAAGVGAVASVEAPIGGREHVLDKLVRAVAEASRPA